MSAARPPVGWHLPSPDKLETADVLAVDLIERRVVPVLHVPAQHEPVRGIRVVQVFLGHRDELIHHSLSDRSTCHEADHRSHRQERDYSLHDESPFNLNPDGFHVSAETAGARHMRFDQLHHERRGGACASAWSASEATHAIREVFASGPSRVPE